MDISHVASLVIVGLVPAVLVLSVGLRVDRHVGVKSDGRWPSSSQHATHGLRMQSLKFRPIVHCVQKKKHPLMFSIITPAFLGRFFKIIFVPVEREMNTLQFTYLQS